jgi:hypothetical protein
MAAEGTDRTRLVRLAIVALAVATAAIHIALAIPKGAELWMFYLNGLGYLGLTAALYLPIAAVRPYRRWLRWALMAYTMVTILGWVAIGERTPIGFLDKIIEVALVALLWLDQRWSAPGG